MNAGHITCIHPQTAHLLSRLARFQSTASSTAVYLTAIDMGRRSTPLSDGGGRQKQCRVPVSYNHYAHSSAGLRAVPRAEREA